MRLPVRVKHRKEEAVIYGKTASYCFYRVAVKLAGRRVLRSFGSYSEAREYAECTVRALAQGNQATTMTPKEASDALAIRDVLAGFYRRTGRSVSALEAVTSYVVAVAKLGEHTLDAAVDGYLSTVAAVKRKDIADAVSEYLAMREPETAAPEGKRPALAPEYFSNLKRWLNEFADTFPGHCACDLHQKHIDVYLVARCDLSPKSRNDRRAVLRMFLGWCVRRQYLPANHRLLEADKMKKEKRDCEEIDFYRPSEFRALLDATNGPLQAVIAICGLAGLRTDECLRLTWEDVWRSPGSIEITARIAKGRSRRLVDVHPALASWLEPFRTCTGPVWPQSADTYHATFAAVRERLKIPARRNGLRHAFVTFHFAQHHNESLTAAMAGNSPPLVHRHYRGLATKAEADKWFNTFPAPPAANVVPISKAANE